MTGMAVHGTCVILGTRGVFLRGPSGAGKSTLAEALLTTAAGAGKFAALVADDRVHLGAENGRLIARPPETIAGQLEIRGLGIVTIPFEAKARVDLVIDLVEPEYIERLPENVALEAHIEGVRLVRLAVPVRSIGPAVRLINRALTHLF